MSELLVVPVGTLIWVILPVLALAIAGSLLVRKRRSALERRTGASEIDAALFGGVSRRDFSLLSMAGVSGAALIAGQPATAAHEPLGARLSADDRLDLIDLHARYAWAYNCYDADGFVATFTADGQVGLVGGTQNKGHEALRVFAAAQFKRLGALPPLQVLNNHFVFHPKPDGSVVAYCYWTMIQGPDGDGAYKVSNNGYYESHCVKQGGVWLISQRIIHPWNCDKTPWA